MTSPGSPPNSPIQRRIVQLAASLRTEQITRASLPTVFTGVADFDLQALLPLQVPDSRVFKVVHWEGGLQPSGGFDLSSFRLNNTKLTAINGMIGGSFLTLKTMRLSRDEILSEWDGELLVDNRGGSIATPGNPAVDLFVTMNFTVMDPLVDIIRINGHIVCEDITSRYEG